MKRPTDRIVDALLDSCPDAARAADHGLGFLGNLVQLADMLVAAVPVWAAAYLKGEAEANAAAAMLARSPLDAAAARRLLGVVRDDDTDPTPPHGIERPR